MLKKLDLWRHVSTYHLRGARRNPSSTLSAKMMSFKMRFEKIEKSLYNKHIVFGRWKEYFAKWSQRFFIHLNSWERYDAILGPSKTRILIAIIAKISRPHHFSLILSLGLNLLVWSLIFWLHRQLLASYLISLASHL